MTKPLQDARLSIDSERLQELLQFPLVEALFGRRSRRFFRGAEIPDGPLAYKSKYEPEPLDDLEKILILLAVGGVTGWHHSITRHDRYKPHLSNYSGSATGRTFPSAAGFHTSEIFFTDDTGTYIFKTRDAVPEVKKGEDGKHDVEQLILTYKKHIHRISEQRLHIPNYEPYMEGHNSWVANKPGTFLAFPVGDLAQHTIANLCFYVQNGLSIYDDINGRNIPGIEQFQDIIGTENPLPLTFLDQYSLAELSAELATSTYAGVLMQQALGLGGWMFDGIDRLTVLGASADPAVPGLGFRYDADERWALPNPTGLEGVFVSYTPPHFKDMRAAVDAFCDRKFGVNGPFHPDTPGPWKDSQKVRGSAQVHDEQFRSAVAHQAQYIYDTFGKFPATVPSVYSLMYLQTHHLDLDFYDQFFGPHSYLHTHAKHLERWHSITK
ncbi:hypothetical protein P9314_00500 [Paenibacillus validus]|uniref:Uncharacterized protein n=1 Tax=Paenibacillus validus TaxID=44253 RepID=A0A7X2ZAX1_9BACL|nr:MULTISPECIES: hypothetical protein [Paenibacillus]MED4599190.1 hypothetical protein [Paenibacillus validus]MED4606503.1 hypothetical protein [Paenibacillus validus]MUG71563.1 hypothetical protein [Paenibacillus validus]